MCFNHVLGVKGVCRSGNCFMDVGKMILCVFWDVKSTIYFEEAQFSICGG